MNRKLTNILIGLSTVAAVELAACQAQYAHQHLTDSSEESLNETTTETLENITEEPTTTTIEETTTVIKTTYAEPTTTTIEMTEPTTTIETIVEETPTIIAETEVIVSEVPQLTDPEPAPPQPVTQIQLSEEDAMLLVKTASCEAGNQGVYGMALIMRVVLNRSIQWNMSIHDVLYQPDQFNCVYGDWWANNYIADGVYEALALVQSGWDDSYGATFFCTPQRNTWHMSHLHFLFQYGNMQFYTEIK